jgi:hypothetical protein
MSAHYTYAWEHRMRCVYGERTLAMRMRGLASRIKENKTCDENKKDACGLVCRCPSRDIYHKCIRTSSIAAPHHQAVSPREA